MHTLIRDLLYSLRQIRRAPAFTLTTVLTLTTAITANVVVFGIINSLLLHSLPVPDSQRIVQVEQGPIGQSSVSLSYPNYRDLRDRNRTFAELAACRIFRVAVATEGSAHPVWGYEATGNYFQMLGIQPQLGRFFTPADDVAANGSQAAVLSDTAWRIRFHADPAIIGKRVLLNKIPFTVVAVAPAGFGGTERFLWPEVWVPFHDAPELEEYASFEKRGNGNIFVLGRLRPGVTSDAALADLTRIAGQLAQEYPKYDRNMAFHLARPGLLGDMLGRPIHAFLFGLMAMALLVLIAACANLGALFSSRTADRARELGIRLAIGATRGRILQGIMLESVVVSLLGGLFASLASLATLHAISRFRPAFGELPIQFLVDPGPAVFFFAAALALATGLVFGLIPARQIWRTDPNETLKSTANASVTPGRALFRSGLLVLQIALCCLLVTSSFVALRGLQRTFTVPFGFDPSGVTLASLDLHAAGYSRDQQPIVQGRLLAAAAAIPGVTSAAFASSVPLSVSQSTTGIYKPGTTNFDNAHTSAAAAYYSVSPAFFTTAGMPLLAGRPFNDGDTATSPTVAVINQTFARKIFGSHDPTGRDVLGKRYPTGAGKETEIVGLVADGKYNTLTEDPGAAVFWPESQAPDGTTLLLIRSGRPASEMVRPLTDAIASVDPDLPLFTLSPWSDYLQPVIFPARAATVSLGILGALAVMLAFTGVFGMAAYTVGSRMRELGIRSALGANRPQLLRNALGRLALLLAAGSTLGLLLGFAASRLLAGIVYSATASDPLVLVAATVTMVLLGLVSTALPARRALRVDPAILLRE